MTSAELAAQMRSAAMASRTLTDANSVKFRWLKEPWEHQRQILERAVTMRDYALFAEMGTGKTFATVNILRWRYLQAGRVLKTLIFCPPVVCEAWRREIESGSKVGHLVEILGGEGKLRTLRMKRVSELPHQIFITNYESLDMKELVKLFVTWRPEILVLDESHRLKNPKSKRLKAALPLADGAKHRYVLTGSPILKDGRDLWSQFRLLDGGETFGDNYYAFQAKYFVDKNAGMKNNARAAFKYFPKWLPIAGSDAEFNRLIYRKATRVLKKDCLDLPPLVKKIQFVELSAKQQKAYDEMKAHFLAYIDDKACVASIALTKALRLQQIVSGHFVDDEGVTHEFEDVPRANAAASLITELAPDHKVIVWCAFRHDAERICNAVLDAGIEHRYLLGGMPEKLRQASIDEFQKDPTVRVMVANQQAGGTGVTLTAASYALYYSRNFSLEADLQSEARNHRGGSEIHEKVTRIDLVCQGTIDEVVLQSLYQKENLAESILKLRGKI